MRGHLNFKILFTWYGAIVEYMCVYSLCDTGYSLGKRPT
jgi:hypothetical protein